MIENLETACERSGFVPAHARVVESVADRVNCIILFREPGKMAGGLIAEGYAMKGFRIDTKSCNWGPMAGFVCMDPRLTKDESYIAKNTKWTREALTGEKNADFFGEDIVDPFWVGDVAPVVISRKRIDYLVAQHVIQPRSQARTGHLVGESQSISGKTRLSWRLIPVANAGQVWLKGALADHHVLCGDGGFRQMMPDLHGIKSPVKPIMFKGYEAILGLCNPQTKDSLGFKGCVTADYDLFAIWPGTKNGDLMDVRHDVNAIVTNTFPGGQAKKIGGGVPRVIGVDTRLQQDGLREHHRYGDVSARVMTVKALLNSAIQNPGGNAVHHNDEAGNFALAKGTLQDCLPIMGFLPSISIGRGASPSETFLVETLADFKELVTMARDHNFRVIAKDAWLREAGV